MTTGYSVEIVSKTELTLLQKTNLLAKCKAFIMIEHNDLDAVIADLILKEIEDIEEYTNHFLTVRVVKVNVLSVLGILDLSYMPVLRSIVPVFSDSQAIVWGSYNSLIASSTVPVSVTYYAGYAEIPLKIQYVIFENLRIFLDREDNLKLPEKIKAMEAYRKLSLSNLRQNALISSYV